MNTFSKRYYQCHFSLQGRPVELKPFLYRQLLKRSMFKQLRSCQNPQLPKCACGAAQLSAGIVL
jgi:hypothetical protein